MDFWKPLKEDLKKATKWMEETKQKEQEKTMQKGARCFTLIIVMCQSLPVWYYIEQKNKTQRQKKEGKGNYLHLGNSHFPDSSRETMTILP